MEIIDTITKWYDNLMSDCFLGKVCDIYIQFWIFCFYALIGIICFFALLVIISYITSGNSSSTNSVENVRGVKSYSAPKPKCDYRDCMKGDKALYKEVSYDGRDFVAIDFETATWSGSKTRHICQIGIAYVHDGLMETYNYMVRPYRNYYDTRNVEVHGITPTDTEDCYGFVEVWGKIRGLFECGFVIAHNTDFDVNVLKENLSFYGLEYPNIVDTFCTCSNNGRKSLKYCCTCYGVDMHNHHNAECDAVACAEIYMRMYDIALRFV